MKVSDIISGKIDLKPLRKEKKGTEGSINKISENLRSNNRDSLSLTKIQTQDLLRLQEMQNTFFKSNASLDGFNEMTDIINKFEQKPEDQKDWNALSRELKSTVTQTLYKGESVVSYLSTNVKDEKSLYTLKANLLNEVKSINSRISQTKKQISQHLIKEANKDAVVAYNPQEIVENIKRDLTLQSVAVHSGEFKNTQNLLKFEN